MEREATTHHCCSSFLSTGRGETSKKASASLLPAPVNWMLFEDHMSCRLKSRAPSRFIIHPRTAPVTVPGTGVGSRKSVQVESRVISCTRALLASFAGETV